MYEQEVAVANLRQLRRRIENVQLMPLELSIMLFDSCLALGLSEGEAQSIIGPAFVVVEDDLEITYREEMKGYYGSVI